MRVRLLMIAAVLAAATLVSPALAEAKRGVPRSLLRRHVGPRDGQRARRRSGGPVGPDGAIGRRDRAHRLPLVEDGGRPRPTARLQRRRTASSPSRARTTSGCCPWWPTPRVGGDRSVAAIASPPRDVDDYTAFIENLIARYGPAGSFWDERPDLPRRPLREWQIWNEPHLQGYWNTSGRGRNAWAREYAELLKSASRRIRELDPGATVVLAGLADFAWRHSTGSPASRSRATSTSPRSTSSPRARTGPEGRSLLPRRHAPRPRAAPANLADGGHLARGQGPRPAPASRSGSASGG